MISDTRTTFADKVASGDTGTNQVGSSLDLEAVGTANNVGTNVGGQPNIGNGQPVYVTILATEGYTGASSTDHISFSLVTSDNAGLTSSVTLLTSASFIYGGGTDLVAGQTVLQATLPITTYKRFVGVVETVVGTTTTGKISAFLHTDPKGWTAYKQATVNL